MEEPPDTPDCTYIKNCPVIIPRYESFSFTRAVYQAQRRAAHRREETWQMPSASPDASFSVSSGNYSSLIDPSRLVEITGRRAQIVS